eukprot:3239782-Rhodomonas_salina.2
MEIEASYGPRSTAGAIDYGSSRVNDDATGWWGQRNGEQIQASRALRVVGSEAQASSRTCP